MALEACSAARHWLSDSGSFAGFTVASLWYQSDRELYTTLKWALTPPPTPSLIPTLPLLPYLFHGSTLRCCVSHKGDGNWATLETLLWEPIHHPETNRSALPRITGGYVTLGFVTLFLWVCVCAAQPPGFWSQHASHAAFVIQSTIWPQQPTSCASDPPHQGCNKAPALPRKG